MSEVAADRSPDLEIEVYKRAGLAVLLALGFVVLGWGGLSQISGAVVAPGRLAVASSVKRVQHREGGIVSEVLVRDGAHVREGQVVARLDGTVPVANAAVIDNELLELTARKLRLEAESDNQANLVVPPNAPMGPDFAKMLAAERRLMEARRAARTQRQAQLREQIVQSGNEVDGLQAQVASEDNQRRLIESELVGVRTLYQKGLAPLTRVTQLEREAERLTGERGQLVAAIARARTHTSEIKLQGLQLDSDSLAQVMTDLKETETKVAELSQQKVAAYDQMRRIEVKAPATGFVQQLAIHTRGGVVTPGETLMLVVPDNDALVVEARIDPQRVDQVRSGRRARIRFTAFSAQTTPEVTAIVDHVSADVQSDEKTGTSYYIARLKIDRSRLPKLLEHRLVPGMPAEVQIETSRRNALSYFFKPISDQLARTFRED